MTTRSTFTSEQRVAQGLEQFLAAIRFVESGSYDGDYRKVGTSVRGAQPQGAYQILDRYWPSWAHQAGIPGADWRDPVAQDRVAGVRAQKYFDAYGSWDLAAVAWLGGTESVRKITQRGYTGPDSILSPKLKQYLSDYTLAARSAPDLRRAQSVPRASSSRPSNSRGGWVHPVAGPNEWSSGSWMPNSLTHRGRTHAATDIYAERGTPIVAPVSGKVISTKTSDIGGHTVRIQGDDGLIYYFAHMNDAAVVGAGQRVMAGNHLGFVGNSGSAKRTKPHLHFSIKKHGGDAVNPTTFLSGAESSEGIYQGPSGVGYGESAPNTPGASQQMNDMLSELSNRIAGGQRNPDALIDPVTESGQSSTLDVTPSTSKEEITKTAIVDNSEVT